ncbi:hypothetical protein [Dyadobacter pollutisoli]|jgi:D-psicose/D-tagatose/L-ribulose 3-epimerase|uniref:Sugar phosphate isomerase/epimerase n=1 Tax=Dyadobacter pollutisoli TaxID=2910158 RepID=A0A9E8NE04_9BACT|nr:hypothetical protein [Dyadobacter pollutisoli]WAC15010.1 hypothetical protein ON006_13795 [Dyadobacter pollutisoli]
MKFGINTFLFTSPFKTKDISLFSKLKKWGFDSVEIAPEDVSHIDPFVVKQALDDKDLTCNPICAALGLGRDLRGSLQDQEFSMKYLMDVITVDGYIANFIYYYACMVLSSSVFTKGRIR